MRSVRSSGSRAFGSSAAGVMTICLILSSLALAGSGHGYKQRNLVSDKAGFAVNTDANLVNPWGMAISDEGAVWIANEHTATAEVFKLNGNPAPNRESPLVVQVAQVSR